MTKIYKFTDKDDRKVQYMGEFPPTDEVIEAINKLKNGESLEEVDFDTESINTDTKNKDIKFVEEDDKIDYDTAVKAQKDGKTIEWYCDRDNTWNTCEPGTSELLMAKGINAPLRIKKDFGGEQASELIALLNGDDKWEPTNLMKNIASTIKSMDNPFEEE